MRLKRRARQYGDALFNAARKVGAVEEVYQSLALLVQLTKEDASFRSFFHTRRIESDRKSEIVERVLADRCHPMVADLFGILAEKREYQLLQGVFNCVETRRQRELELLPVTAYTSVPLGRAEVDSLRDGLEASLAKKVEMSTQTDDALLGGIKLRMGNIFLDGTLRGQLERLRTGMIN